METLKRRKIGEVEFREERFPTEKFDKSCLIYMKNDYGIFLVTGKDGQNYTIKVNTYLGNVSDEVVTALYIQKNVDNPNLLLPEAIYVGRPPFVYPLFDNENYRLQLKECKSTNLRSIFKEHLTYTYYITKACLYNLGYYLGTHKGTLTYKAFVAFSFQILAALQSLHNIKVWHRDIKPQNILICNSELVKDGYNGISYIFGTERKEGKVWTIKYEDTEGRDVKIIDYGESYVMKEDTTTPCLTFEYEVTVATVSVFNVMWNKVIDKDPELSKYDQLISLLKNCKTSIFDVLQNAEIYSQLLYETEGSYKVNIF